MEGDENYGSNSNVMDDTNSLNFMKNGASSKAAHFMCYTDSSQSHFENEDNVLSRTAAGMAENLFSIYDKNGNSRKGVVGDLSSLDMQRRIFYPDMERDTMMMMDDCEDMDEEGDEDDTMSKFEYDSFKSMVQEQLDVVGGGSSANQNNSSSPSTSSSPADQSNKPMDKSSVRQFCIQVAEHLFQCSVCGKTYTHISNFSRHFLSAHHGLRQEVPCPVCCRIFTRRDNMLTHMKQVHRMTIARGSTNCIKKLKEKTPTSSSESGPADTA